jgi:hypothetical protein
MNSHQRRIAKRQCRAFRVVMSNGISLGKNSELIIGLDLASGPDISDVRLYGPNNPTFYERYRPGTVVTLNGIRHRVMALDIEPDPSKELTMQYRLERIPDNAPDNL